jgi:DNA-binding NarL/FixJ family response regulator
MSIKVSIVEDNASVREGLAVMISDSHGFALGDACASAEEAYQRFPRNPPNAVLMDIHLPSSSGVQAVRDLRRILPQTQFLMLTVDDDTEQVFAALRAGATGYLLKSMPPAEILAAVRDVHAGGAPMSSRIARMVVAQFQEKARDAEEIDLTPRERELLELFARGYRSKEAAEDLRISVQTVHTHVRNIYEKLHVRSRAEAVARFLGR